MKWHACPQSQEFKEIENYTSTPAFGANYHPRVWEMIIGLTRRPWTTCGQHPIDFLFFHKIWYCIKIIHFSLGFQDAQLINIPTIISRKFYETSSHVTLLFTSWPFLANIKPKFSCNHIFQKSKFYNLWRLLW